MNKFNPSELKKISVEVFSFRRSLSSETDRGCALMASSYLDEQLKQLLKNYFIKNEEVANNLLGNSNPLGTFSSRINLTYALGLINKNIYTDLHIIRKIRNDFAHVHRPISFNYQNILDRCSTLKNNIYGKNDNPRRIFTNTIVSILANIHAEMIKLNHREEPPCVEVPQSAKEKEYTDTSKKVIESLEDIINIMVNDESSEEKIIDLLIKKITNK